MATAGSISWLWNEGVRRGMLLRQPRPEGVKAPPLPLFLSELRSLRRRPAPPAELQRTQRPMPVLLVPGFAAHPKRMAPMARALEQAGHRVYDWGMGVNFGATPQNFAFLLRRVATIARQNDAPVALVGWSLGGLFAREIARREPRLVAKVITMGTPFSGNPRANNAWRAYELVTGHAVDAPPVECDFTVKPPVPTIALWSPRDGVIHPRSAAGWPGERDRAVSLRCSHLGFAGDAAVIREVLRQLEVVEAVEAPAVEGQAARG